MFHSPLRLSAPAVRYLAMWADVFIIWFCGWASYLWVHSAAEQAVLLPRYQLIMLAASLMMLAFSSSVYRSWRVNEMWVMLRTVATTWLGLVMAILVALFFTKHSSDFSRLWFSTWVLSTLAAMWLQRVLVYSVLRKLRVKGYNFKTVLLVGQGRLSDSVVKTLSNAVWSGLRVVATVPADGVAAYLKAQPNGDRTDEVWLCLPLSDEKGMREALDALRYSTANIRLVPDLFALKLINHGVSEVVGIPMLDLSASPITGDMRLIKTAQDYLLGSLILLLISPLMLGIAVAIKLTSKGPVLYKQHRHGWNGEKIWVYKFRSMSVHTEKDFQITQAARGDKRITPLGAFLRRTSLDELPQFINVLQGHMSIVGPRPHAVVHNEHYKELLPGYMLRHKVKPGITGWAQINGYRGETDTLEKMQKRVEFDLHYIENLSLALDLKIIVATVFKGFVHRNAY